MKKKFKSALIALGIALMCGNVVFAKSATVYVDENEIKIPQKCIVEGDHLLMPLRSICENLGYEVFWDEEARQVRIKRDFRDILYTIDSSNMVVNNIKKKTEIKPRLVKDRTYVSLESLAEALGENVQWQKENGLVGIELDYGYENGNWQEIFDLEKSYEKKDDNGDVLYSIHVSVPQLANYKNDAALEKINEYYRNKANSEFNDYAKLAEDDMTMRIDKEGISYASGYRVMQNFRNILSIYRVRINKQQSPIVEADVFNVETGEKLTVYDILKGSKKDIDQMIVNLIKDGLKKTPIMVDDKPITYNGGLENVDFAMQGGDLVFFLNPIGDILHFRLKLQENKEMFNIDASDKFNYAEEKLARKVAMDSCNEYVKLIEKTTLGTDECYVYEKYNDDTKERIAIDRSLEKIYKLKKKNGMYLASSKRRIKDEVSDRDAVKLVRNRIDSNEYTTSVYGNMKNSDDGQEYSIINVRNLDGTVDKKLAVSRKDGAIYVEKKKVTPKLEQKDDGTISAVGFLEIDPELTNREANIDQWGSGFRTHGSYMLIQEDGTGVYNIGVSADVENFKLVNENGKNYIEITNKEGAQALEKGTRFWVEVKEVNGESYLYVHDEENKDSKPGNKYWKLGMDNRSIYVDKDAVVPALEKGYDGSIVAVGRFKINDEITSKETDTNKWGTGYLSKGSCMSIKDDKTGTYSIGETSVVEHFKLVDENGKTYIEITNEEGSKGLLKGTRFLVEIKEVEGKMYLYMHDEDGKDTKPGSKYWELSEEGAIKFEPYGYHNKI